MIRTLTIAAPLALLCATASAEEWRPDLVAMYESDGGQNVPNFRYDGPDGHFTAGGVCQMTNTNWRRIAPTVDIDLVKFPVAGSAPEFLQWQACWKLWSLDGYDPWTCCNAKLRRALGSTDTPRAGGINTRVVAHRRGGQATPIAGKSDSPSPPEATIPHDWDVFPDKSEEEEDPAEKARIVNDEQK